MLTFLTLAALVQCRRNGAKGIDAGEDIGVVDAAIVRPISPGLIRQMGPVITRGGMDHRCISRQFGRWPGLAISRDRTIDQFWIELLQHAVIKFQPSHHPRAKILHDDVGASDKPAEGIDGVRRFQIENETLLTGIELAEHGTETAAQRRAGSHRLPFSRFDLDNLRSHVGEHPRAMGTGNRG